LRPASTSYTIQQAAFATDLRIASQFHPLADDREIVVTSGSRLPGVPTHTAKFGLAGQVTTRLDLGVNVRAQSGQSLRGDEANLLSQLSGFSVVSAHARQRITDRISAVAQVQNILGADYYTFGTLGDAGLLGEEFEDEPRFYTPGAPRSAWIGLEVRF
jgi:iron complex outermembrane receptor protein